MRQEAAAGGLRARCVHKGDTRTILAKDWRAAIYASMDDVRRTSEHGLRYQKLSTSSAVSQGARTVRMKGRTSGGSAEPSARPSEQVTDVVSVKRGGI
jgi:hypothetical protein